MFEMGGSIREDVEVALHEHRFVVTKLLESLHTASLYVLRYGPCFFYVSICACLEKMLFI